ncbi:MAG: PEGA domain-containing protein [Verrucomicrobiales bacterium]|nr:PEGA domain-containing protein [Verrucomicrobiales bacterium]
MNTIRLVLSATLLSWIVLASAAPSPPVSKPKVAVLRFENSSRHRDLVTMDDPSLQRSRLPMLGTDSTGTARLDLGQTIDRTSDAPRALLERALSSWPEIELIERQHVDLLQRELDLNRARRGQRMQEEQILKRHGVDCLVLGQVLDVSSESFRFDGYGTAQQTDSTVAQIYVRVVRIAPERIVFAQEATGSIDLLATPFARPTHSDTPAAALREAVRELVSDPEFRRAFVENVQEQASPLPPASAGVEVRFQTEPTGATIEVAGRHVGSTPLTRSLAPGMDYTVRFAKPGFRPWSGRITPEPGLLLSIELEPIAH